MNNATMQNKVHEFPKVLLRGVGQVMFQDDARTGLLFMIGIFWGAYEEGNGIVAWGALVGIIASTITGYILALPDDKGAQGLWGFNGVLVGCAFPTFLGNTPLMWMVLILCSAMSTWVRAGFNKTLQPLKINSLTFPFVFTTWIFLLSAREFSALAPVHLNVPEISIQINSDVNHGVANLVAYWLKGISQVFLINSAASGALFLIGLAVSSHRAAIWGAVGSAVALIVAIAYKASGADISTGMYGFSAVLTGIALGQAYSAPGWRTSIWTLVGIVVTVFAQAAMNALFAPFGLATLTAPFCVVTWIFLIGRLRKRKTAK